MRRTNRAVVAHGGSGILWVHSKPTKRARPSESDTRPNIRVLVSFLFDPRLEHHPGSRMDGRASAIAPRWLLRFTINAESASRPIGWTLYLSVQFSGGKELNLLL